YEIKLNVSVDGEEKIASVEQSIENLQRKAQDGVSVGAPPSQGVPRSSGAQRALAEKQAEQARVDAIRRRMERGEATPQEIQEFAQIGSQQATARRQAEIARLQSNVIRHQEG